MLAGICIKMGAMGVEYCACGGSKLKDEKGKSGPAAYILFHGIL
jgi:hypothetical protein